MNLYRKLLSDQVLVWIIRSLILGLLIGPVITLLTKAVGFVSSVRENSPLIILAIPLGAFITALLYQKVGPYLKEGGSQVIDMINQGILDIAHPSSIGYKKDQSDHTSNISTKMAPLLFISTCITHLVGASGGKEGVGVQIGASIGSYLNRFETFLFSSKDIESNIKQEGIWLISGAGAAFGALFNAPIAGTLFGLQFSNPRVNRTDAMLPCLISSFTACIVSQALHTSTLIPVRAETITTDTKTLLILSFIAVIFGLASRLFCFIIHKTKEILNRITSNPYKKVLVSSSLLLLCSVSIYALTGSFQYNGLSVDLIIQAELGNVSPYAPIFKLLLTALTIGAGFMGGEVIPILVIGATFGSLFASFLSIPVSTLSMFGAIGMLSGSTKLPIACFVLGLELFGFGNSLSLFLVCSIAYIASGRLGIYEKQIVPEVIGESWDV